MCAQNCYAVVLQSFECMGTCEYLRTLQQFLDLDLGKISPLVLVSALFHIKIARFAHERVSYIHKS